jgi:hypothetical protein
MSLTTDAPPSGASFLSLSRTLSGARASLLRLFILWILGSTSVGYAQSPPALVSVTPADGTIDLPTSTKLVFVLDQALKNTVVAVPSFPPFLTGSFEITPSSITFGATISSDRKTITLTSVPPLPENTTIQWKLNPTGSGAFTLVNNAGQALPTISGSFKTKSNATGTAPKVLSMVPLAGATEVSATTPMVFTFDQDMDTSVVLTATVLASSPGNFEFKPFGNLVTGSWATDKRTLTFVPSGFFLPNTLISWTLNPAGTTKPLKSVGGQPLATISGTFKTAKNGLGPASTNELCHPNIPIPTNGSYVIGKMLQYHQSAADQLQHDPDGAPFYFSTFVNGPTGGQPVTNASITFPNGTRMAITNRFGNLSFTDTSDTEAELESMYPAGNYVIQFQQNGLPERTATMSLPATSPNVPRIVNISEAQDIEATAPFTLRWNSFSDAGPNALIQLTITDEIGNLVYLAPNFCIPRELSPSESSAIVPANYFKPGMNYRGTLTFGIQFFSDTNSIPGMSGYGSLNRTTTFPLKTTGSGGGTPTDPPAAAKFTSVRPLANGQRELTLSGTASRTYTIQRVGNLAATIWPAAGTVTMNASGSAVFVDTAVNLSSPAFYRAVGN